jgi:hypothetical protein
MNGTTSAWRAKWHDFFTFGPEERISLFSIVRIDLGFRPTAGLSFSWTNIKGDSDPDPRPDLARSGTSPLMEACAR